MANMLLEYGFISWFVSVVQESISFSNGMLTVIVLGIIYFYSMYGFSMLTAHIAAMAAPFLGVCLATSAHLMSLLPFLHISHVFADVPPIIHQGRLLSITDWDMYKHPGGLRLDLSYHWHTSVYGSSQVWPGGRLSDGGNPTHNKRIIDT